MTPSSRSTAVAAAAAATGGAATPAAAPSRETAGAAAAVAEPPTCRTRLNVNGRRHVLELDARTTLLDALRNHLHLTGTKKGCDHGQCGACTVLVGGERINACLSLVAMHDGDRVTTVEGLGTPDALHPMQAAFVAHDGMQCGFCTPGQICSAVAVLDEIDRGVPSHVSADLGQVAFSAEELRERLSGNLCRCAAYTNIVAAVSEVQAQRAAASATSPSPSQTPGAVAVPPAAPRARSRRGAAAPAAAARPAAARQAPGEVEPARARKAAARRAGSAT